MAEVAIGDVARMARVTARTLRHYESIGLLTPSSIGTNGYRHYGDTELLRLFPVARPSGRIRDPPEPAPWARGSWSSGRSVSALPEIAALLDKQRDEVAALREHHGRLLAERDRLDRMAATVARTIRELSERGRSAPMTIEKPENLFEGFGPSEYEQEARERWPEEAATSERFTATQYFRDAMAVYADRRLA